SHIADPHGALTLDAYEAASRSPIARPVPLHRFVAYGQWFGQQVVPDLDRRRVERIDPDADSFRVMLEDGEMVRARRVVVATGIAPFARRPVTFAHLPPELASHTSAHSGFARFAGREVAVIGGGQSALEGAALLHEAGATVRLTMGRSVTAATPAGGRLRLVLGDGTVRQVDHALLATGYAVDVARYAFLPPKLLGALDCIKGSPRLTAGFESSVPGLHFL